MHKPTYRLVHVWRPKVDVRCLLQLCSISVWVGVSPCTWNSLNPPSLVSQLATGTPCLCLPNARITGSHCAYLGFTFSKLRFPCLWGNCFIHWAIFLTTTPSGVWEGPARHRTNLSHWLCLTPSFLLSCCWYETANPSVNLLSRENGFVYMRWGVAWRWQVSISTD